MSDPWSRLEAQRLGFELTGLERARRVALHEPIDDLGEDELWRLHESFMPQLSAVSPSTPTARLSLLHLKRRLAELLTAPCRQCLHFCEVDRLRGERGVCGIGSELRVYNEVLHYGEEPEVSPTWALFLSGCSFRCRFCSDWKQVIQPESVPVADTDRLAARADQARLGGAASISFIGGSPDVNVLGILELLCRLQSAPPLVWNSNMSSSPQALNVLNGLIDVYIPDLKFGPGDCSARLGGFSADLDSTLERILALPKTSAVIVRHLLMPGHLKCCTQPVLEALAKRAPGCRVEVLDQYWPMPQIQQGSELASEMSREEREQAWRLARSLPLQLTASHIFASSLPKRPAAPATAEECRLRITADGELLIEHLSPGLLNLKESLGQSPDSSE